MSTVRADNFEFLNGVKINVQSLVDNVNDLRTTSYSSTLDRIWLSGYYGVGTPGGGPLYRDSADTTTADNGGTVFVDTDGVRWKRPDDSVVSVLDFGAKTDGTETTAAANNALASGASTVILENTGGKYLFNTLSIGSSVRKIWGYGWPEVEVASDETNLITETGINNLEITGIHFRGFPNATENSDSRVMEFENSDYVRVHKNRFTNCPDRPVQFTGLRDSKMDDNEFIDNSSGTMFDGCRRCSISGNKTDGSQQADSVFKIGHGLAPYNASYGSNEDILIQGNSVQNLGNSQGFLVHSGTRINITGNISYGNATGISINPIDSNDKFFDITVTGNNLRGISAAVAYTPSAELGISLNSTSTDMSRCVVASNVVVGFNKKLQSENLGGVSVIEAEDLLISNNSIADCHSSGIVFSGGNSTDVSVKNNLIKNTDGVGDSAAIKIEDPTVITGSIRNNTLVDNVRNYRLEGVNNAFQNLVINGNDSFGEINDSKGTLNAKYEGALIVRDTTLTTPDVSNGVNVIVFQNSSATTITDLVGAPQRGVVVVMLDVIGNTTISEDSDGGGNFNLSVNSNFVFGANDTLTVIYNGSKWQEVSRSVN